jgi:hypothetical protein
MLLLVAGETEGFEGVHAIVALDASFASMMDFQALEGAATDTGVSVSFQNFTPALFVLVAAANLPTIGK